MLAKVCQIKFLSSVLLLCLSQPELHAFKNLLCNGLPLGHGDFWRASADIHRPLGGLGSGTGCASVQGPPAAHFLPNTRPTLTHSEPGSQAAQTMGHRQPRGSRWPLPWEVPAAWTGSGRIVRGWGGSERLAPVCLLRVVQRRGTIIPWSHQDQPSSSGHWWPASGWRCRAEAAALTWSRILCVI